MEQLKNAIKEAVKAMPENAGVSVVDWDARPFLGIRIAGNSKVTDVLLGAAIYAFIADQYRDQATDFVEQCAETAKEKFSGGVRIIWFKGLTND
jgi:hypothetical protein